MLRRVIQSVTGFGLLAVLAVGLSVQAAPPENNSAPRERAGQARGEAGAGSQRDQVLAELVALGNQGEIEISKFALARVQHDAVKNFANQMVEDHSKFLDELRRFSGNQADNQTNSSEGNRQSRDQLTAMNLLEMKKQIAQQCLKNAKRELEQSGSEEIDQCYIGMQLGMHAEMLAMLEVLSNQTSGDLQQLLAEGLKTTQHHFQEAKALIRQLEGKPAKTAARAARNQSE